MVFGNAVTVGGVEMAVKVSLRSVADELEAQMDGCTAYLNRETGDLCTIGEEEARLAEDDADLDGLPDWQRSQVNQACEVLDSEEWLPLPTSFDVHEWAIMDELSRALDDPDLGDELLDAIRGTGAFRCFRDVLHRNGIEESWYGFKAAALAEIAADWLDGHGISYARDVAAAPACPQAPIDRIRWLAGCWDLVEGTFTAADGAVRAPWGAAPVGVLLVTPSGELSAHGGRRDRAPFAGEHPTSGEKQQAYDDYFSYHGRIARMDDEAGTMVTAVDGATIPGWIGGEQLRYLDIQDDDHIVLRTPPLALAGGDLVGRVAWRRLNATPILHRERD